MPDHYYMELKVICPHCDCDQYDSHEFDDGYNYECDQCDNTFSVNIEEKDCPDCEGTGFGGNWDRFTEDNNRNISKCENCKKGKIDYYSTTRIGRAENE